VPCLACKPNRLVRRPFFGESAATVNRVVYGHTLHAVGHLLLAFTLPAVGYVAVSQRSPKAAWAFTVMATVAVVVHLIHLAFVLYPRLLLGPGGPCSRFAQPCKGSFAEAALPADYSKDHRVWRCFPSDLCIHGHNRCDHNINCFDASDEMGCHPGGDHLWRVVVSPDAKQTQERCQHLIVASVQAPKLKVWWIVMSVPLCGIAKHAAELWVACIAANMVATKKVLNSMYNFDFGASPHELWTLRWMPPSLSERNLGHDLVAHQ